MEQVQVYGASDDLIELEGAIREEFAVSDYCEEDDMYLGFSNGTLLSVTYIDGIWRIHVLQRGDGTCTKVEGTDEDEDYTDRVTVEAESIEWVVAGKDICRR